MTVLAMERDETDKVLYTALAKGADRAVKITGVDEAAGTHAVAKAMCQALEGIEYDVVLTGVQAADDRDGQLGVLMAGYLDIPHVSVVSEISFSGDTLTIHKEYSGGTMYTDAVKTLGVEDRIEVVDLIELVTEALGDGGFD